MLNLPQIEERLIALGSHAHDGDAKAAFAARLDYLKPQDSITSHEWAVAKRKFRGPTGEEVDFNPSLTPYMKAPTEAGDIPGVRVVAIKGNTRCGKTVGAENLALKRWDVGPLVNVIWFMQDEDSINDYIDERGEDMLVLHTGVNEKIDWTDRRNSRKRKKIGRATLFYRPATMRSTRSKAAPFIVADEIDAYQKKIRDAILGLIQNRQREFGTSALAYLCSHPDAGPDGGIDAIINDSLVHLWWVNCPHCGGASSPAAEAETRITWNVPELLQRAVDMERQEMLRMIRKEARLICPHEGCYATFDNEERIALMKTGRWLQPHQKLLPDGTVEGESLVQEVMGFVIHADMAPFVNLGEDAANWAAAFTQARDTGNDVNLRERTVKDRGETYFGSKAEEKTEPYKVVLARMGAPYELRQVPPGVKFLTAFVDVQGDRFEVRVIGWSLTKESWLIDAYAIKQWPKAGQHGAFENIDPANKTSDWDIIEEAVLCATYPLQSDPKMFMPIAKTYLNASGQAGVTKNARVWVSNMLGREPGEGRKIHPYQITLFQGSAFNDKRKVNVRPETYGRPRQVEFDDAGKPLRIPIYERTIVVHDIKKIIMRRSKIDEPGPGKMYCPANISPRYIRELVAERLVNGEWIASGGANETLDGWVACEAARENLKPDRPGLWDKAPVWAQPRERFDSIDTDTPNQLSVFDRLAQINDGAGEGSRR